MFTLPLPHSMRRLLPFLSAALLTAAAVAAEPVTFTIKTLPAQMRYDITEFLVKPGAEVKIIFENPDDMPHNILFFQPGTDVVAVCNKQLEKPEEALKRNWLPEDPRLWAHSNLVQPKGKEEITFRAPEALGIYPYVCSMPGHAAIMNGRMKVFSPGPRLADLKFQLFLGAWKKLPDFSTLTPHREGALADNLVEIKLDDYKNEFGVVYTGKLKAPSNGEYTFAIAGDDGVRLLIDGKKVVEHDGIHPADIREAAVKLKAGDHDFRLEYFQAAANAQLFAAWRGPDFSMTPLSKWVPPNWKEGALAPKKDNTVGMPLAVKDEPVIYRNFIRGAGNRGIGVGFPGAVNLAWNAETMNLAEVWRGAFIDAARHWNDRGGGHQPPLGYDVFDVGGESAPSFAILAAGAVDWPKVPKGERPAGYDWKGYTLDAKRVPTFSYEWNGLKVSERFEAQGQGLAGTGKLIRTVKVTGTIPPGATFRAAAGAVQPAGANTFIIESGTKMIVEVEGGAVAGSNLVVPARAEIKVTYSWPTAPGTAAN